MELFSFSPPINFAEEGKWLLTVTSFEAMNSVFEITDANSSFSFTIPGYWSSRGGIETMNRVRGLLRLRAQTDIELPIKEVRKTRKSNEKRRE